MFMQQACDKLAADRGEISTRLSRRLNRATRPRLLADIRDRRVDIVVVYKVDRLTRRRNATCADAPFSSRPALAVALDESGTRPWAGRHSRRAAQHPLQRCKLFLSVEQQGPTRRAGWRAVCEVDRR
jgi:hypothetical protein